MRAPAIARRAMKKASTVAVLLMLCSTCEEDTWPPGGRFPGPDGSVAPSPFDPNAGAGRGAVGRPDLTRLRPDARATDRGATDRSAAAVDRSIGDCNGVPCFEGEFCLLGSSDPTGVGVCLPVPLGCTSCYCMKPF